MAKVIAPLFSMAASGKLANSLVYLHWKGIDDVRQYVIPTNPRSPKQTTQRSHVKDAVAAIHAVSPAYSNLDKEAWARFASLYPTPRTWFNEQVKNFVDQRVAGLKAAVCCHGSITEITASGMTVKVDIIPESGSISAVKVYYGRSKTFLPNSVDATKGAANDWSATLSGLNANTQYFIEFVVIAPNDLIGVHSGIYAAYTAKS